jgi:hypothetical protein
MTSSSIAIGMETPTNLPFCSAGTGRLDEVPEQHADDHSEQNPYGEEAVKSAETFDDGNGLVAFRYERLLLCFKIGIDIDVFWRRCGDRAGSIHIVLL